MLLNKVFPSLLFIGITIFSNAQRSDINRPSLNIQQSLQSLTTSKTNDESMALSVEEFGLDLLYRLTEIVKNSDREFMISPFSIWSLMLLLLEGSAGNTYKQLKNVLRINVNDEDLRSVYRRWTPHLNTNTSTIEVASLQAIFTDKSLPIDSNYKARTANYNALQTPVDFKDPQTTHLINENANKVTRGLIKTTVAPQDIFDAKMFLLSSLFFKGQWKFPFNESLTRDEPFYNENNVEIAKVKMMKVEGNIPYVIRVPGLDGYVIELPYGQQDRLSMIIILPKQGFTLRHVVENLKDIGLKPILDGLAKYHNQWSDGDAELQMPRFTTSTDLTMNQILEEMGIKDLFDSNIANLSRMAQGLFVNKCIHSTKIIVDEEGTIAGAVTSAVLVNKASPPKFLLNRPFQYMIVEKTTGILLFAGQVKKPV